MAFRESEARSALCPINAIIIDSHRLFRDALGRLLDASLINVVGQGRNLEEALHSMEATVQLHLAIFSFESDTEALRELLCVADLRVSHPGIKLVVLADLEQRHVLLGSLHAGVEALLSRNISSNVLQRSLELVQLGQRLAPTELLRLVLDPSIRMAPAQAPMKEVAAPRPDPGRAASLTPREGQILHCLMDGRSNKEIARELQLTEATVKAHVKALLRKTRMTNRTQAAIWAVTNNFQSGPMRDAEVLCADGQPEFLLADRPSHRADSNASGSI